MSGYSTQNDIEQWFRTKQQQHDVDMTTLAGAAILDEQDQVSRRKEFFYPSIDPDVADSPECIYLCGNSLGIQPVKAKQYVIEELDRWGRAGVRGHFEGEGRHWAKIDDFVHKPTAKVVGALPGEVAVMNGLTANLHLMFVPFYRPTSDRFKIIMEAKAFPSDRYMVESQVRFHGLDPAQAIVLIEPRQGEHVLREEDIIATIEREGSKTALVFLPGVHYYTGQVFDVQGITAVAHAKGCKAGFDLAHAVGNVQLKLHDWDVDFACWCTYKYLNSGPGGIAGAFVHERHCQDTTLQRFSGWWGHDQSTRFDMTQPFKPDAGARSFQLSNPPILQCVSLLASLEIFEEVGMTALRAKSELLTGYLMMLINKFLGDHVTIITPSEPQRRGCQLSIILDRPVKQMFEALSAYGVVCDMREPDVIRIAPAPLYNTFSEVHKAVELLAKVYALSDIELRAITANKRH